jgi:putative oxidoreductase
MNPAFQNTGLLVARVLLGAIFVIQGYAKTGWVDGFGQYMASGGIPAAFAWPAILFEIIVGLALIVGFQTRLAAIALAVFTVVAGVLYHYVPGDQMQMISFQKNLAMAGGYIALALIGAGAWSVDAVLGKRRTQVAAE